MSVCVCMNDLRKRLIKLRLLLKSNRYSKSVITIETRADEGEVARLIEYIGKTAAIGHSFSVVVDPDDSEYAEKFWFDGDGAFRILSVKEKKVDG